MAYLTYTALSLHVDLPRGWDLREATDADLSALNRSYDASSGGLLLKAMGLHKTGSETGSLEAREQKIRADFQAQLERYRFLVEKYAEENSG